MVRNRGGLLASTGAMLLAGSRFASFGRVPDGDGGQGGGGGASGGAAEEDDFFAGVGGDGGQGDGGDGGKGGGGDGGGDGKGAGDGSQGGDGGGDGKGEIPEWVKSFSGEKTGDELSHQEWLAKAGVKDLNGLAQIARDNQKALRESGRVKIPGEGATEAELKTYREAIGAPLEAAGYEVKLPEAAKDFELDTGFLDGFRDLALQHNVPSAAFAALAEKFMEHQLGDVQSEIASTNSDKAAKLKEWGPDAEQGKAEFSRGMRLLGLKVADVQKIQRGFGAGATMDMLRKLGQLGGEDFFAGNQGGAEHRLLGVTDEASAKKAVDSMVNDPETAKKIRAKDPVTVKRYNGLTAALAHFREQKSKA